MQLSLILRIQTRGSDTNCNGPFFFFIYIYIYIYFLLGVYNILMISHGIMVGNYVKRKKK